MLVGSLQGIVANVLDFEIIMSLKPNWVITFNFRLIPLGKGMNPLIPHPQLWVKYCSSTRRGHGY